MPTYIVRNVDPQSCAEHRTRVIAGLKATAKAHEAPGLVELTERWVAFRDGVREERAELEVLREAEIEAAAVVSVMHTAFDRDVTVLSGESYLAAGKDASAEPYKSLFGAAPAAKAETLGPDNAVKQGERTVRRSQELAVPRLEPATAALAASTANLGAAHVSFVARLRPSRALATSTANLGAAHADKRGAEEAIDSFGLRAGARRTRIQDLISETERDILALLPGRKNLVHAVLSPWKPRRQSPKKLSSGATTTA